MAWFSSASPNSTVSLIINAPTYPKAPPSSYHYPYDANNQPLAPTLRNTNATAWMTGGVFYVGDTLPPRQALAGGLRVLGYNFTSNTTGNSLAMRLNVSGIPPGQYPRRIGQGLLTDYTQSAGAAPGVVSPTLWGNVEVEGWLKIGVTPSWGVFNAEGVNVTGSVLDPALPASIGFTVQCGGGGGGGEEGGAAACSARGVIGGFSGGVKGGGVASNPPWGALASTSTASLIPLPPTLTPTSTIHTPTAVTILYSLAHLTTSPGATLPPGNYTLATLTSGTLCNGLRGRDAICTSLDTQSMAGAPVTFSVGYRPWGGFFDAPGGNPYGGALDASGAAPLSSADTPIPCLSPSITLTLSHASLPTTLPPSAYAWEAAVTPPDPGFPPPMPQTTPPPGGP